VNDFSIYPILAQLLVIMEYSTTVDEALAIGGNVDRV
jgi:hypothetical protein